mgnify:CR=1 FL=1
MSKKKYKSKYNLIISIITLIIILVGGYYENKYGVDLDSNQNIHATESIQTSFNLEDIPEFDGKTPYVIINNKKYFIFEEQLT